MNLIQVPRVRAAGFGLIELMIALVLGILVMGAAFAVFQSNQASYRANEGLNRIQESVRVAHEMMARDLRATGGGPCSNTSIIVTSNANSVAFRDQPVTTSSTSELTTVSGDDASYRISASTLNTVDLDTRDITATEVGERFKANDWLLLCNASRTAMVQISGVSGSTLTYAPDFDPGSEPYASPTTASAAKLRSTRWFTATNSRGGKSLFVQRFGATREEVAEGVQSMAITYLAQNGDQYKSVPAAGAYITAVRIDMALKGEDVDGRTLTRNTSNVISLRSHTL